jgi:hypothetical protein
MEGVSRQAAEILLAEAQATPEPVTSATDVGRPSGSTRRVTRPMAEALTRLAEVVEPAAEAAQEWLESKDDEDHAAIAEARDRLLATLDQSPDLTAESCQRSSSGPALARARAAASEKTSAT